jgi:hypothetical protein
LTRRKETEGKTHPTDLHLEALYLDLGPEHRKVLDHFAPGGGGWRRASRRSRDNPSVISSSSLPFFTPRFAL